MRCKKEIMGLAALMIVVYHFYIPFGTSAFETYMFRSTFIGVDMFFFVSAYSLASRNKEQFKAGSFILNRLSYIYAPFVFLAAVAAIYNKWDFVRFLKSIIGVEFYERGGGAFLWYFIGIMLIYFLTPLFMLVKRKLKNWGFPVLLAFWAILSCILQFGLGYTKMFILVNRLPIYFIGMYFDDLVLKYTNKMKTIFVILIEAVLFIVGTYLSFKFCTTYRVIKPFADMYYVIGIPLVISAIMIVNTIVTALDSKYKSIVLKFVGGITMELYGLQMVFGYDIEQKLLKIVPKSAMQLAVLGTIVALIVMAVVFNQLIRLVRTGVKKLTSGSATKLS